MQCLNVPIIDENIGSASLHLVSAQVDSLSIPYTLVGCINWTEFVYKPETDFQLVHFNDGLFLHYRVKEINIRALVEIDNGPVYTDSCVEFFIDPTGKGSYYNFEFNAIGHLLLGCGPSRMNRELAKPDVLGSVKRISSLGNGPVELFAGLQLWELLVWIPFSAFFRHNIPNLIAYKPKCNIYKCGDLTRVPHYLSWSPIETIKPDFHQPAFFGPIILGQD
jgi:hypothetical protein